MTRATTEWDLTRKATAEKLFTFWRAGAVYPTKYSDLQDAVIATAEEAERLVLIASWSTGKPLNPELVSGAMVVKDVGGHAAAAKKYGVETPYLAAMGAIRELYRSSTRVSPTEEQKSSPAPAEVGNPLVWKLFLIGITGAAVVGWKAIDSWADVRKSKAKALARINGYLKEQELLIVSGKKPSKSHPPWVNDMANKERLGPWLLGGVAAGIVAVGAGTVWAVMRKKPKRSNPRKRIAKKSTSSGRKAAPKKKAAPKRKAAPKLPAKSKSSAKKKQPGRKSNPAKWTKAIAREIGYAYGWAGGPLSDSYAHAERRKGRALTSSDKQAVNAGRLQGIKDFNAENRHRYRAKKSNPVRVNSYRKSKAGPKKAAPKKKAATKKRNAKKAATKKKQTKSNPRKKAAPKKKRETQAEFVKRMGNRRGKPKLSPAHAKALWKGQQANRKARRAKK